MLYFNPYFSVCASGNMFEDTMYNYLPHNRSMFRNDVSRKDLPSCERRMHHVQLARQKQHCLLVWSQVLSSVGVIKGGIIESRWLILPGMFSPGPTVVGIDCIMDRQYLCGSAPPRSGAGRGWSRKAIPMYVWGWAVPGRGAWMVKPSCRTDDSFYQFWILNWTLACCNPFELAIGCIIGENT